MGEVHENDAGEKYIKVLYCPRALSHRNSQQLSEYRRLTVRKWKDMVLVDIREVSCQTVPSQLQLTSSSTRTRRMVKSSLDRRVSP